MECPMYWMNLKINDPIRRSIEKWIDCKAIYLDDINNIVRYVCTLAPSFLSDEDMDVLNECEKINDKKSLGEFLFRLWNEYDLDIF